MKPSPQTHGFYSLIVRRPGIVQYATCRAASITFFRTGAFG
jgi:hypothetical protein